MGSGKMALDIGGFLLARGAVLTFVTSDRARLPVLESSIRRLKKRISRMEPDREVSAHALCCGDLAPGRTSRPDVVLECTSEILEKKKRALAAVLDLLKDDTLLISNSSSILPDDIHERCIGVHFFYPVMLKDTVELILPREISAEDLSRVRAFLGEFGLGYVVERRESAFMVNRLLLPLQAEAMRYLLSGHNPRRIDEWSASKLLPLGQLSLLDDIGFDVVDAALENYISRGDGPPAEELQPLKDGLRDFIASKKLGKKNKDGLLTGGGLAPPENGWIDGDEDSVRKRFLYLFINECLKCMERFLLGETDLTRLLSAALLPEQSFREVLIEEGNDTVQRRLMDFYHLHGYSYFAPSGLLN